MYKIDRITSFTRGNKARLSVSYSEYDDWGKLLAQNHSINVTLVEEDSEMQSHIDALNKFALSKLEVQNV
jgi:hypothetical protein